MNERTHRKFSEPECSNVAPNEFSGFAEFPGVRARTHARTHTQLTNPQHTSRTLTTHITQETEQAKYHNTRFFFCLVYMGFCRLFDFYYHAEN